MEKTAEKSNLRWWILLTVIIGTFLGRLDQTIVNLALPKIISDFGITVSTAGWIGTAYILANAVFVPIWGKLGDTIGRKKVYVIGFSIFILGSALAGLAWNFSSMLVFRIIQAVASSADYPTAMAILTVTFTTQRDRAQALGIWSSAFAASAVLGPLIGGPLIDSFSWRMVFLINIPIGVIGIIMAMIFIRESVSEHKTVYFDWWGAFLLGGALTSVTLVLDKGSDWGWLSASALLCYFLTVFLMWAFIKVEQIVKEPLVDLHFFKNSIFVNTLVNNFIIFMGMIGSLFIIPIFAQTFLGYTATESGYLFIPMAGALMLAAPLGGRLTGRVQPKYVIIASTLGAGIGLYFFTWIDPRSTPWDLMFPLMIMAFCMGFGMAQRTNMIASAVPQSEIGVASSVLALIRNIAGAFGIAIFSAILTNSINSSVVKLSQHSTLRSTDPLAVKEFISLIILKAEVMGFAVVFWVSSLLVIFGGLLAFSFKKVKMGGEDKVEVFVEA
ncbi:MAG TPA: MDR family MFS transporter [Candidatus Paceibacterota bacterium]|nr:MDR family MFS transporter [Candidatus Paceibacterota bacterium]